MSLDLSTFTLPSNDNWLVHGNEKSKYENIFESLGPVGGQLPGDKVKPVLLNSKLPLDTLGKVWELSDINQDGFLDKEEFCVAMYLVYRAIDKEPVPSVLPANLIPPSKRTFPSILAPSNANRKEKVLPGAVSVLPTLPSSPLTNRQGSVSSTASPKHAPSVQSSSNQVPPQWVVSPADRSRFAAIYQQKRDPDGLLNGSVARDVFVQSNLSQAILAHVWNLCDQNQVGKLTQDQFVLAMHLISQKVKGIDLPTQLTPQMVNPSSLDSGYGDNGSLSDASSGIGDSAAMRELDALNQEIEELRKEKESLTGEIQQKEASIRTASHEVQELQDTLDRNSSSLAQLECDKSEAHTRLDELDQQRNKLDAMLTDVKSKVQEETENIKSLRAKISAQEASVGQQEVELRRVRGELAKMKNEEMQLEQRLEAGKQQQATVDRSIDEASNDIKKVQGQIQKLQDQQKTVESNIKQYDQAVAAIKSESTSDFAFDELNSASMNNMAISESVFSMGAMQEKVDDIKQDINDDIFKQIDDPFKSSDPFEGSDPFAETDPFSSSATPAASSDPFAGADPFASSVGGLTPTPTSDPFNPGDFPATSSDPFKPGDFPSSTSDPFKPGDFGADVFPQTTETQTDPFGGQDPFATTKSSGFDTTLSSASSFAHDPFSSSEVFSGGEQPKITDSSKPTSVATTFDSGSFAAAFSDNGNTGKEDFFSNAFPTSNPTETKSTSDPWGSAFGGGAAFPAAEGDPFGGDSFTTPTQSDGFGKSTFTPDFSSMGKSKEPSKAPPRPAKPAEMSTKGVSEAEQLRWARDESRKAEEERRKLQLQEQADLELAIALSKQP